MILAITYTKKKHDYIYCKLIIVLYTFETIPFTYKRFSYRNNILFKLFTKRYILKRIRTN